MVPLCWLGLRRHCGGFRRCGACSSPHLSPCSEKPIRTGMEFSATYLLAIIEVAWINILLSGDNAVVIALACRSLPPNQKRVGVFLGSAAAIVLRIIFAFMVTRLMAVPYLQAVGGALLVWIAVSLTRGNGDNHDV